MTDYLPLLSRAITGLERNTGDARRSVYERARAALLKQLRSMNPPLAESEITRERLALEEAIRRIEAQLSRPPERAAPPPPPPPPSAAPTPPPAAPFDDFTPEEPAAVPPPLPSPPPPRAPAAAPNPPASAPRAPMQKPPAPPPRPAGGPGSAAALDPFGEGDPFAIEAPALKREAEPHLSRPLPGNPTTPPPLSAQPPAPRRPAPPPAAAPVDDFDIIDEIPAPTPVARGPRIPEPAADSYQQPSAPAAQPRPYRGRAAPADFAKADAQKAMKAKMIVGSTIGALVLVALLIGFLNRDRIFSMGTSASRPAPSTTTSSEPPKASDRVPSDSTSQQASRPQQQGGSAAAVAQRAVLYEENPSGGGQQLQTFVGTVLWRTETVNPGPGRPPELGMRVEVEVPDRKMTVVMTIRRNPDTTLPASHTVEVQFTTPGDPFGGVSNVPGLRAKTTETAQGAPLSGLVVRVMPGFFLIGLSAIDADREQNLMLLRERGWLDLPFVYNNGRRAVLVIEKGAPGERVMNEALAAWGG